MFNSRIEPTDKIGKRLSDHGGSSLSEPSFERSRSGKEANWREYERRGGRVGPKAPIAKGGPVGLADGGNRRVTLGRKPFERVSFQRSLRSLPSFQGAGSRELIRDDWFPRGPGGNPVAASTKDFVAEKDGEETALKTRVGSEDVSRSCHQDPRPKERWTASSEPST